MTAKSEFVSRRDSGIVYNCENDPSLNSYQQAHLRGECDVNAPIPQENGKPLPSLALQWKDSFRKAMNRVYSSRNR